MKLGFIGTGNMASAIMGGIIKKQIIPAQEIIGADLSAPGRERAKEQFGIQVTDSNKEVVDKAEVIVLSVKPQFYEDVINEIKGDIKESQIMITIAPGKTLAWLAEKFGKDVKIVRTMPNTPAMVGAGMTAACPNEHITEEEMAYINEKIYTELEFADVREGTREGLVRIIRRMVEEDGIQAIILGCTELPLALDDRICPVPCLDTMKIHVQALVEEIIIG